MTLEELIGFQLVFGIQGTRITPEIVGHFRSTGARGIILYRRNFESPDQIRKLISDLEAGIGKRLLVCVDHEGGRVVMFGDGVTVFPDSAAFGKMGDITRVERQGAIEAAELKSLGVDVSFAPVLDVMADQHNPGILWRSYGKDPDLVARMGAARIRGLQKGGISATAKHYPGKGHATVDAHLKLPVIDSTLEEMEAWHLKPFLTAIQEGVDLIMSSHPCYRKIDPSVPATFSRKIVGQLLRYKYGFTGVIVTDDLEMGAVQEVSPIEEAVVKAALAGHDLFLVCHTSEAQKRAHRALLKAYQDKSLDVKSLEASAGRIESLLSKRRERFSGVKTDSRAGLDLAFSVAKEAVTLLQEGSVPLPLDKRFYQGKKCHLIFPRFSDVASKIMIEGDFFPVVKGFEADVHLMGVEPPLGEVEGLSGNLAGADLSLLFCYDAHLYSGWKDILRVVQENSKQCVV
ncbi:MAG: beta-N-acetylhexosaminidase, partial [Elusimicrobia bacterium]|nr:beta-N-acetylhexosaminidase [Elusimicrobiota bacterium]